MTREPYPLSWPPGWLRAKSPRRSTFRVSSFARVRDGVLAEIIRLGGTRAVITSDLPTRRDGLPYGNASEPGDRGVAVWWVQHGREMVVACDVWDRVRDNLRAIECSLQALRSLKRWGSTAIVERAFAGFAALPPAPVGEPPWRATLGLWVTTLEQARDRYRELARAYHPDLGGEGLRRRFERLRGGLSRGGRLPRGVR